MADRRDIARMAAIMQELKARECQAALDPWVREVMAAQGFAVQAHHRLLISKLQDVADGRIRRLMVFMPPGSAKSTYGSIVFPTWLMRYIPGCQIISASHTGDLAESMSRRVMGMLAEYGPRLLGIQPETEGVKGWEATNGSSYKPVGVGGPITGRRADFLLIDDPVKSRQDAASKIVRDGTFGWYLADAHSRLRPGGRVVLIMTRWHEDDLAGRLLASEPDQWHVVRVRAESLGPEDDPLGRPAGQFLWDDDPNYGFGQMLRDTREMLRRSKAMADWESLYQQDPRPGEGGLFNVSVPVVLPSEPLDVVKWVRGWDLAATASAGAGDPDYTVGVLIGKRANGRFVVGDVVRFRAGPDEVEARIKQTAQADGRRVIVGLPQDPGQAGKAQAQYFVRQLAGFPVKTGLESGNKSERAMPFASQWNAGNVDLWQRPGADWLTDYLNEFEMYPNSKKDDQVDASSRAFNTLFGAPPPVRQRFMNWMGR